MYSGGLMTSLIERATFASLTNPHRLTENESTEKLQGPKVRRDAADGEGPR